MKKSLLSLLLLLLPTALWAGIPAAQVMTLYRFNGDPGMPYYRIADFRKGGPGTAAGTLAQGSSLIPCLVIRDGAPLTDRSGTPFVGFEIVVDARKAGPESTERFKRLVAERQALTVTNHHCGASVEYVIDSRNLYALNKAPSFDPPASGAATGTDRSTGSARDEVVRAFHQSAECAGANRALTGRRAALERAWDRFIDEQQGRWPRDTLLQGKHLDYVMRTAIYEGHLERGCNAYGACERNLIALSIRNRGRDTCTSALGCTHGGDFQGVSSKVSQYNIWDEYLTQVSGLTSCFLRPDLAGRDPYAKLQRLYQQSHEDVERILYGSDEDLRELFPDESLGALKSIRHYYHAPAMGKCFPDHPRMEYISGAVARKGGDFALIVNRRIQVDEPSAGGYLFRDFLVKDEADRDLVEVVDRFPEFVIDARKVDLKRPSNCPPYGIPSGCRFDQVGRYRKTPSWINAGTPLEIRCRVRERGEQCQREPRLTTTSVGGVCDKEMRPVGGVR